MPDTKFPLSAEHFSDVIETIYQGPLDPNPWQGFIETLRPLFQADGAILLLRYPSDTDQGAMITDGFSQEVQQPDNAYAQQFYATDPFVNLPAGDVVTLQEYFPLEQLQQSEFYLGCLEPFNILHLMGVDIQDPSGLRASLRLSRGVDAKAFSSQDKKLCSALIPHLQRALVIHSQIHHIESERALYANTVDQLSVAMFLLNEQRQIMKTNQAADLLLKEKQGINKVSHCLALDNQQDNQQLRNLINKVIESQNNDQTLVAQALQVQRPNGDLPLGLIVRSIPTRERIEGESGPAVAVFVSDPLHKTQAPAPVLAQLFGFTPAEAKLAMQLANGLSLDEAVEALGVSRNTGRAHLRSIFAKTGVTQQTQLVRLILKSVASLG